MLYLPRESSPLQLFQIGLVSKFVISQKYPSIIQAGELKPLSFPVSLLRTVQRQPGWFNGSPYTYVFERYLVLTFTSLSAVFWIPVVLSTSLCECCDALKMAMVTSTSFQLHTHSQFTIMSASCDAIYLTSAMKVLLNNPRISQSKFTMKSTIFWDIMLCSPLDVNGLQCYIPKDGTLLNHCENLKSYKIYHVLISLSTVKPLFIAFVGGLKKKQWIQENNRCGSHS
jgi:hypothetical protein